MIGVTASLSFETGSTDTPIAKVRKIGGPSWTRTKIDTTHLGIDDGWMVSEPGMSEGTPVTFEAEYSAETWNALQALNSLDLDEAIIGWTITPPSGVSGATATFDGYLTKLETSFAPNELVVITGEVTITGPIEFGS